MGYKREKDQVRSAIISSGDGAEAIVIVQPPKDPITGLPSGVSSEKVVNFVATDYTKEDIANPDIANGLLKIMVPAFRDDQQTLQLVEDVLDKNTKVRLPDGKVFSIRYSKITRPDGVTPVLFRLFLGA